MTLSSSVSVEAMFVRRLFADGKLTVASANLLRDKFARQSEAKISLQSDIGLISPLILDCSAHSSVVNEDDGSVVSEGDCYDTIDLCGLRGWSAADQAVS